MAVITLAVFNDPDLNAARLQAGVADAQMLQAGLLPDPVVSGGVARSALHTGYDIGLSEDLKALITRGAARAAAKAHEHQVNLEILWQEWQVAEKARELFIQLRANDQLRHALTTICALLADRSRQDEIALKRNNMTADTVSTDLAALTRADAQLRQLQLYDNLMRHQLNQLLGLKPDAQLHLVGRSASRPISHDQFQAAITTLPRRRADLLALQAGYQSQEQSLREAVLAQFPAMSAGVQQARDPVEGVNTIGVTVNLALPIFNRNRGQIALQRATRAVLYQTYQARLDQAVGEADQIWQAAQVMAHQLQDMDARLPATKKIAAAAEQNFRQGNLSGLSYVSLRFNFLAQQAQDIRLRAALNRAHAALLTLLGLPFDN